MKNHDLIAFYTSQDTAERARDDLLEAGFDRNDTKVYTSEAGEPDSFWDSVKDAFGALDDEDRALYAEAGRRGASAVAVSLEDADGPSTQRAITILEGHGPIDLEQQAAGWRSEGWTGGRTVREQDERDQRETSRGRDRETIPGVGGQVRVGKARTAGAGVRLHSRETPRPTDVDMGQAPRGESGRGASYDEFVNEIATDTRYRGRDWDTMEPDVRRSFEQRYPGSRWDQARDSVRRGYERRRPGS